MPAVKQKVLFVCIHNSARSQIAEAYLKVLGGETFEAESAGIEPGNLNPNAVALMQEDGIDISGNNTKSVADMLTQGRHYDTVITVCDAASAEQCPVFPGRVNRIAWYFTDPSQLAGSTEEILTQTRKIRDEIKEKVKAFIYAQHTV